MYYRCAHTYQGATAALVGTGRACTNRTGYKVEALDVEGWALFCAAMTDPEFLARAAQPATPTGPDHSARMAELRAQMAETVRRAVTHHLPDDVLDGALTPLREELARLERGQPAAAGSADTGHDGSGRAPRGATAQPDDVGAAAGGAGHLGGAPDPGAGADAGRENHVQRVRDAL